LKNTELDIENADEDVLKYEEEFFQLIAESINRLG